MTLSLRDQILSYDRPVPRYTSYPTAPNFQILHDPSTHYALLSGLTPGRDISLYLHVPFCHQMCWYCGCHTKVTKKYSPVAQYTALLREEITLLSRQLGPGHKIGHIHFGGGSPGMVSADDFTAIMDGLRDVFDLRQNAEIAIEIDPRGVDPARVEAYAGAGVNRVSLGVQDFNDKVMDSVNRHQPYELSRDAVALFRAAGINRINCDLIYGLPHQDEAGMLDTIKRLGHLSPDRVSLFGYAHVPWMKKHMRLIEEQALPGKALRYDLFETGARALQDLGYVAIGIDHFAKADDPLALAARQGRLLRNFQGYTDDVSAALVGIGASSISRFEQAYVQNAVSMTDYSAAIQAGRLPGAKICPMDRDDIIHAAVIERIMCDFTVDLNRVTDDYGLSPDYFDACLGQLQDFADQGFVGIDGGIVSIAPQARPLTRLVAAAFDQYLKPADDTPRHARAI